MRTKIVATTAVLIGILIVGFVYQKGGNQQEDRSTPSAPVSDAVAAVPVFGVDQGSRKNSRIPIYITPYYDSDGPRIEVGVHSEELAKATSDSIGEVIAEMKEERLALSIETMFVASIRLYDLGLKDESVYWFYTATYRSRLLRAVLTPESVGSLGSPAFELIQAISAFHQLGGEYINGYAFGQLEKLDETIRKVKSENEELPRLKAVYPKFDFIAEDLWPSKNSEVSQGLNKLLDHITSHADEIKAMRIQNGIEGKY
jgi:hypothetical protein